MVSYLAKGFVPVVSILAFAGFPNGTIGQEATKIRRGLQQEQQRQLESHGVEIVGSDYCTFAPDWSCYELGWPSCCVDRSLIACPTEPEPCRDPPGADYCTFAPNYECYPLGWPSCCLDKSLNACPAEPESCVEPRGTDYCTFSPNYDCYPELGWPSCCLDRSLIECPVEPEPCANPVGESYCTFTPDSECYPQLGFPICCVSKFLECPEQKQACYNESLNALGSDYCTYGFDYECYPDLGKPACCLDKSNIPCPAEQPPCYKNPPGSDYCTQSPDVECYPGLGFPVCCSTLITCPEEKPPCFNNPLSPPQDCVYGQCDPETHYCDNFGNCIIIGLCAKDADCFNTYNDPYAVALCVGELKCKNSFCEMDCGVEPPVPAPVTPADTTYLYCTEPDNFSCYKNGVPECCVSDSIDCGKNIPPCDVDDGCLPLSEIVCTDPSLSDLCSLVRRAGLVSALDSGLWTVFAPQNFDNVPGIESFSNERLKKLLLFHVIRDEAKYSDDLFCRPPGNLSTMGNGKDSRTLCEKGRPVYQKGAANSVIRPPAFTGTDIKACNGVAHTLNKAMMYKIWN